MKLVFRKENGHIEADTYTQADKQTERQTRTQKDQTNKIDRHRSKAHKTVGKTVCYYPYVVFMYAWAPARSSCCLVISACIDRWM